MEDTMKKKSIADKPVYQEYLDNIPTEIKEVHMNKVNPLPGLTNPVKYIEKEYPQTAK